jgi:imidazolonepropionase-like amidohydrolase
MTLDVARVMSADCESGSIAVGKFAHVLAVRGDPLRHIDVLDIGERHDRTAQRPDIVGRLRTILGECREAWTPTQNP